MKINRCFLNKIIFLLIIFSFSFFYLIQGYKIGINEHIFDEGLVLTGAQRVIDGEVIYRDFWALYPPGIFYFVAAAFKVLGTHILSERILTTIIYALLAVSAFFLLNQAIPYLLGITTYLILTMFLSHNLFYAYPTPYAILFSILSLMALNRYFIKRRSVWLFLCALSLSLVAFFRQDTGFYTLISILIVYFYHEVLIDKNHTKELLRIALKLFLMFSVITSAFFAYFIIKVPFNRIVDDLIIYPLKIYPQVRALPYLSGKDFIRYVPMLFFALTIWILLRKRGIVNISKENFSSVIFCQLMQFFTYLGIARWDKYHLFSPIFYSILLFGYASYEFIPKNKKSFKYILFIGIGVFFIIYTSTLSSFFGRLVKLDNCRLTLPRSHGCLDCSSLILSQQKAIRYIQSITEPGEKIFCGNDRHDRIIINDILIYFLVERKSATAYHELAVGIVTVPSVQREIISDIIRNNVRCIVLANVSKIKNEPNKSSVSSGVFYLDRFIKNNYKPINKIGPYLILWRSYN